MQSLIRLAVPFIALLGLAACHTIAGAGQDLSSAGHAISNTATSTAHSM